VKKKKIWQRGEGNPPRGYVMAAKWKRNRLRRSRGISKGDWVKNSMQEEIDRLEAKLRNGN